MQNSCQLLFYNYLSSRLSCNRPQSQLPSYSWILFGDHFFIALNYGHGGYWAWCGLWWTLTGTGSIGELCYRNCRRLGCPCGLFCLVYTEVTLTSLWCMVISSCIPASCIYDAEQEVTLAAVRCWVTGLIPLQCANPWVVMRTSITINNSLW